MEARLVLWQQSFLPRQIEFVEPSGNPIRWDIQRIAPNAPLRATDFAPPRPEPGWQRVMVPPPAAIGPGSPGNPPPSRVRQSGSN